MPQTPQQAGGRRGLDDYVSVHVRVEKFRAEHKQGRILTQIVKDEPLTVRAEVYFEGNDSTIPNGVGHADEGGGMGNRGRSALEMTETAAVGRALAFCGYEVKEGIASREEVQKASRQAPTNIKTAPGGPKEVKAVEPEDESGEAHAAMDEQIMALKKLLGKGDAELTGAAAAKFKIRDLKDWGELNMVGKRWLLEFLQKKAKEAAQ